MNNRVRFTALALVFLLVLALCGCKDLYDARGQVEDMLDTLQNGEYSEALENYVCEKEENKDFLGCIDGFTSEAYPAYEVQKTLFESIEYEIISGNTNGDGNIEFEVEITTISLEPMADILVEISETYEHDYMEENEADYHDPNTQKAISEGVLKRQVVAVEEYLKSDEKVMRTSTVYIETCKDDGKKGWKIHLNDELINALSGGIYTKYGPLLEKYMK